MEGEDKPKGVNLYNVFAHIPKKYIYFLRAMYKNVLFNSSGISNNQSTTKVKYISLMYSVKVNSKP